MKVAVTGGTGCLGRPLVRKLAGEGYRVNLLVRSTENLLPESPCLAHTKGDMNSRADLEKLTEGCETVFHLAGKVHSFGRHPEEDEFYRVNAEGTRLLVETARINGVKRIVFYSTIGVYGKDADFFGDETSPCRPRSAYAKSKLIAERLVLDSGGVVLRFPVAYGPFDRGNMAALITAIYRGHFFFFGDGKCPRSMISSENSAAAALRSATEPSAAGEVFCVTDGQDYTLQEITESIRAELGIDRKPRRMPLWAAKGMGMCGDLVQAAGFPAPLDSAKVRKLSTPLVFSCEKAKNILRYAPVEGLSGGIAGEVAWLKAVQGWA